MSTERWRQIPELPGIELDEVTGRIRYKAGSPPIVRLRRPTVWVRHGVTDNNFNRKLNGCLAAPPGSLLNRLGQEQARKMARLLYDDLLQTIGEKLRGYLAHQAVAVWISPLPRACDTAEAFKAYYYSRIRMDFPDEEFPLLPWEVRDELKEQCYGILDGLNPESDADLERFPTQLKQHYRALVTQWRKLESAVVRWPEGETFVESTLRLRFFWKNEVGIPSMVWTSFSPTASWETAPGCWSATRPWSAQRADFFQFETIPCPTASPSGCPQPSDPDPGPVSCPADH
jgi:broad specificity phosphatase PhoE